MRERPRRLRDSELNGLGVWCPAAGLVNEGLQLDGWDRQTSKVETMQVRCILSLHGFLLLLAGYSFQVPGLRRVGSGSGSNIYPELLQPASLVGPTYRRTDCKVDIQQRKLKA